MLENISACPICENHQFSSFLTCKDYTVSGEEFHLQKCLNCGFIFTSPRPSSDVLGNYYKSENYISHSDTQKGLINKLYHLARKIALQRKLKLVQRINHFRKGTILDFGCGTGYFLKTCLQAGWQAEGIEPDENARQFASNYTGKQIFSSLQEIYSKKFSFTLSSFQGRYEGGSNDFSMQNHNIIDNKFDIITLWHVLEHIPSLNETLSELKNLLNPQGKLVIAVPNRESWDAQVFQQFWAAYDVPRHLWHFSKKDMKALCHKHNLKILEILPMPFDAYYISLMSSKYQTGKIQILKGFWQGFLSNLKAGKQNTSSLIYVAKADE
ncbi:MAG: class I SAM-dependent methyltransferase [Raineya sp.]|nr:class I SAM-dependent methyltransferase [Raineya sp.]MDW8297280.1 class I SAM-dependent methyltransferase [Raineya sp.]